MSQSDEELFLSFVDPSSPESQPDFYIDFLGRKTRFHTFLPIGAHLDGTVSKKLPIPDDGYLSEAIEYAGLLMAVKSCQRGVLVVAELGAGWGPWICAAGVAARQRNIAQTDLIAIEASKGKINFIKQHLRDNGLMGPENVRHNGVLATITYGVAWPETGVAHFPIVDESVDYGAAASSQGNSLDYRGLNLNCKTVPAYSVSDLLADYSIVDFMHIDIQGAEAEVCRSSSTFLADRVRYLFVGTHSRRIDGNLVEILMQSGFRLLREKPCTFSLERPWPGSLEGLTTADGAQLWMNTKSFIS